MDPGEKIPDNTQGMDEFMAEIYPPHSTPDLLQDRANWFRIFLEETEKAEREIFEHVSGLYEDEKILLNRDRTPRKERNIVEDEKDLASARLALWSGRLKEMKRAVRRGCRKKGGKGIVASEEYRGTVMLFDSMVAGLKFKSK